MTRGFPSPSLGGFGYIVSTTNYNRKLKFCQLVNITNSYLERRRCPLFSKAGVQAPRKLLK